MAKEICISSTPHETRLAILEDDQLAEIYYERENEYTLAGSIYNGRVTRVLPGMQSAFVDLGLERDAFLYVTDFLELEDQEETDELEKAAASGGNQPPREVRHSRLREQPQRSAPPALRSKVRQKPRPETGSAAGTSGHRPPVQGTPPRRRSHTRRRRCRSSIAHSSPNRQMTARKIPTEPGAKRWRGRRRRRGGRGGPAGSQEGQTEISRSAEEPTENDPETPSEDEVAPIIHAADGGQRRPVFVAERGPLLPPPPAPQRPRPLFFPASRSRKYGGTAEDEAPKSAASASPAAPARPASTFKPATLIEAPLAWDGSGLLPGESLSRHRNRQPETSQADAIQDSGNAPDVFEERRTRLSDRAAPDAVEEQRDHRRKRAPEAVEDNRPRQNPLNQIRRRGSLRHRSKTRLEATNSRGSMSRGRSTSAVR